MTQSQNGILTEKSPMGGALLCTDNQELEIDTTFEVLFPQEASVDFRHGVHFYRPCSPNPVTVVMARSTIILNPKLMAYDGNPGSHQGTRDLLASRVGCVLLTVCFSLGRTTGLAPKP